MDIDAEKLKAVAERLAVNITGQYTEAAVTIGEADGRVFRLVVMDDMYAEDEGHTEALPQDWKGVDGAIAYHLIDRHADGWADIGRMMSEWLEANKTPNVKVSDPEAALLPEGCARLPGSAAGDNADF